MAVEAVTLDEVHKSAGYEILKLTDLVGLDATGAGWAYTRGTDQWRFYLFTEMTDSKGPLWIWERLLQAFSKLALPPGVTPLDIVVASPEESFYRRLPIKFGELPAGLEIVTATGYIGPYGYGVDYLWLLRSRPEKTLRKSAARHFDLKVRQLMAA